MISFWIVIILSLFRWFNSSDVNQVLSQSNNAKSKTFFCSWTGFHNNRSTLFYVLLLLKVRAKNEYEEPAVAPQQSAWEKQGVLLKRGPKNSEVSSLDYRKMHE